MARGVKHPRNSVVDSPSVAMPVEELRGRSVWTDAGTEVGRLRDFRTDAEGRIVALEVQHGWMFGHRYVVDASAMRVDEGSIVVPAASVRDANPPAAMRDTAVSVDGGVEAWEAPALVAGRLGARNRFGGLSAAAGFVGALVAFASAVVLSGLASAIFSSVHTVSFDGSFGRGSDLWSDAMIAGAVVLAAAMLIGGWAAGRVARFDGVANGLSVTAWLVALGAIAAGLGAWLGDSANVFDTADVPHVAWSDVTGTAVIGMVLALVVMLVFGALGGALGSWYNRMVDHSMLRPARLGSVDGVDFTDHRVVSSATLANEEMGRRDAGVVGTPAGSPVAPEPIPTKDSAADPRRLD